jgi:hypothetical protein
MGKLAAAFVLAIKDAQEMFQRNNVLCVYVHVYACWGCGPNPACFYVLSAAFVPWRDDGRGLALPAHKLTIANILDVPCCGSVL